MTERDILDMLGTINDPEMPISIVDLGIVGEIRLEQSPAGTSVVIDILPTFVGCPALGMIEGQIVENTTRLDGVVEARVRQVFDPPWTVDRINERGRESLRSLGITVPEHSIRGESRDDHRPHCPFCGATETRVTSTFGPTRCRMICYCESCKNSFEHLKRVQLRTL